MIVVRVDTNICSIADALLEVENDTATGVSMFILNLFVFPI